jgi:hypothetical protein
MARPPSQGEAMFGDPRGFQGLAAFVGGVLSWRPSSLSTAFIEGEAACAQPRLRQAARSLT